MKKYKVDYTDINSYSAEEHLVVLESVRRYVNSTDYIDCDVILAILGIVEEKDAVEITVDSSPCRKSLVKSVEHGLESYMKELQEKEFGKK